VPVLPQYVEALERHGELKLDAATRQLLLTLSPATADRLLAQVRQAIAAPGNAHLRPAWARGL
jgi:hypothetical protein